MERECDCRAGYKHHLTDKYLEYLKIDLMDVCKREKLHQVDLLSPARKKVTEKEFATLLKKNYNITFKISRGKYSYLLPNLKKAIRGRALGTHYT
ncbi:MAG: hypothetical protein E7279_11070 [Lachnospiraceae bacterium]|nr:hypothetical protein [Lachnospiraceae bacterium]